MSTIKDAMGRRCKVGDRLIVSSGASPIYTVVDIAPVLQRGAPPGMVVVTLQQTFKLPMMSQENLSGFVRVQQLEEYQEGERSDQKDQNSPEKATHIKLTDTH